MALTALNLDAPLLGKGSPVMYLVMREKKKTEERMAEERIKRFNILENKKN